MSRRAATPGEIQRWEAFLRPLEAERADAVIQLLAEVVNDCSTCDEPIRRCDGRALVRDELMHLRCAELLSGRRSR